jgi:dethiobiotin synthetase
VSLFLTGTDTGVGKTYTAAALLRLARASGLRCAGYKPICCGDREDAELLLAASSDGLTIDEVNPLWLRTPAAPLPAAIAESVAIEPQQLLEGLHALQRRFDFVVVEGVGGWLVPIKRDYFVSDLAVAMQLPAVVVALNRLGCLNHTLLTVRSVIASGLPCAGVAWNDASRHQDAASMTNRDVLSALLDVPLLPGLTVEMREIPREWRPLVSADTNAGVSSV